MNVLSIVLQSLLVLMFLPAGLAKLSGSKMHVDTFDQLELPQWFRIVTGLVELVGAAALILGYWEPSWIVVGAFVVAVISIGGIIAHLRVKDSFQQTVAILVIGIVSVVLICIDWSNISQFPGF